MAFATTTNLLESEKPVQVYKVRVESVVGAITFKTLISPSIILEGRKACSYQMFHVIKTSVQA